MIMQPTHMLLHDGMTPKPTHSPLLPLVVKASDSKAVRYVSSATLAAAKTTAVPRRRPPARRCRFSYLCVQVDRSLEHCACMQQDHHLF